MSEYAVELRDVVKTFPARGRGGHVTAVDHIDLGVRQGEFFTLLGPSGCGKTTTLRMIAGFELPTGGEIRIDGKPVTRVPPYARQVNTVFQNYALFPHLTVAQNVGFGLKVARVARAERERRVAEALTLVRLPQMGARRVWELSGGQQQRVALARALINRPAVLLLDEPLGALDLKLRKELQVELKQVQHDVGITFIYVTHDQEEALTMSDRIAVMHGGKVQQIADSVTIYDQPATCFVADFIGETNFLPARITSLNGHQELAISRAEMQAGALLNGSVALTVAGTPMQAAAHGRALAHDQAVTLAVRPERIVIKPASQHNGPALRGSICNVVYVGTDTRYTARLETGETLTARVQNVAGRGFGEFALGDQVAISWAAQDACVLTDSWPASGDKMTG
jgi:spermidine/putrescine transport system ATP-binding protein